MFEGIDKKLIAPLPNMGPRGTVNGPRPLHETLALIGQDYMPRRVETIFTADPNKYIKDPEDGWGYAWPKNNSELKAKLRAKEYIIVDPEEIRDDCPLAMDAGLVDIGEVNEKGVRVKTDIVQMGDLVLVKIPPKVYGRLYRSRAAEALLNAVGGSASYQSFQGAVGDLISNDGAILTEMEHSQTSE